jgi:MFS family permease
MQNLSDEKKSSAFKFVLLIGILSFFADFVYEGARSILGPYLAFLSASAVAVGVVAGLGELAGYGLRLVSGPLADWTGQYWPLTIAGYVVQMLAVPALALAGSWPLAAVLLVLERTGKAVRNPSRDVMLSHAGKQIGVGWVFGLHEALDQLGAFVGPLAVAGILALKHSYKLAFAALLLPALICLALLGIARWLYPAPQQMEASMPTLHSEGLPRMFWIYLAGAALVALGYADFALIAYHFSKANILPQTIIPIAYATAMATSGIGALAFGKLFDRFGIILLAPLTLATLFFAPLVFFGSFWLALLGAGLWGLGMGVHESLIPAAVAPMVAPNKRASAYGLFTAGYGLAWFLGSTLMGFLYGHTRIFLVLFCIIAQLLAVPIFVLVHYHAKGKESPK